jgi:hypothetical protein
MSANTYARLAATIFDLIALLQLVRAIAGWPVTVGGIELPVRRVSRPCWPGSDIVRSPNVSFRSRADQVTDQATVQGLEGRSSGLNLRSHATPKLELDTPLRRCDLIEVAHCAIRERSPRRRSRNGHDENPESCRHGRPSRIEE